MATTARPSERWLARLGIASTVLLAGATSLVATALAHPAGASGKPPVVRALETDFHIALSRHTLGPGKYTFEAENKGHVTHSLEITGPGLKHPHTKNLSPGQSAKLTVTFKNGSYDIFCPVPGHKALGMNLNLRVGSPPRINVHM